MVEHAEKDFQRPAVYGYVRVAACTPRVVLADPFANTETIIHLTEEAAGRYARIVVFPELSLSGYSNDDLFFQDALLDAVEGSLLRLLSATTKVDALVIVGAPIRTQDGLFNCALMLFNGKILAVTPKTYLPNYREFYEKRYFVSGAASRHATIRLCGAEVPFGNDIILTAPAIDGLTLYPEICEDLWVPIPPSANAALAGATVLVNLSASNATVAKSDYRKLLAASQSGRCIAAYVYCAAGYGESTTDLAWDGHALIYENAELLAESRRFRHESGYILADIDLDRLRQDRSRMTSFADCAQINHGKNFRTVDIDMEVGRAVDCLVRPMPRFPFIPSDPEKLAERCAEIYAIQSQGLARRLEATDLRKVVLGLSGGVDSAQALLVAVKAFEILDYPRENILCFQMPGFATTQAGRTRAKALAESLSVSLRDLDIRPSAMQMLRDIGHPYAAGNELFDTTFENIQAGERSSHLFRIANYHGALVIGTSDLCELALGYTTYGVGDQMSHYAVNSSVPKTLVRHLLAWCSHSGGFSSGMTEATHAILQAPASPELLPVNGGGGGDAETQVGPYALADFFLYYISRYGYRPSKVAFLAEHAWGDPELGTWPDTIPQEERVAYDLVTIKYWLESFLKRFFQTSQFKRSALPNGPKVGSGGCLSPRGDWRAPSDVSAHAWLAELSHNVP